MSALRVLMVADVSPARSGGGGERMLWEQASRLAARGWNVRVLCRSDQDGAAGRIERQGVRIEHFPVDRRSLARFVRTSIFSARRATTEALAAEGADVLHLHQPLAGYGALLSPGGGRLPSVYSFYSPAPLEYRSRRGMTSHHRSGWTGGLGVAALWAIERECLRRASLIHVQSDFSAGHLWKLYGVPADRVVKIPGAAELQRFRPAADREALRRRLDLPKDRPVLFTLRNLEARMGLDLLIRAMARLSERVPGVLLLIGGTGSLRQELEALSASLGLTGHVRFLGFVPDAELPRYYQAADVFVLPTRALEGFGLVTVESLACGTPVLGTPVGATPEILAPLSPELIFRDTAPETLADDLARFLDGQARDPEAAEQLRRACRRYAEAHYGWDREVDALAAALSRAVAGRASEEDASASCPACGGPTRSSGLRYRGARYRCCRRCRSSVVATLPTPLELRRCYETDYPRRLPPDRVTQERSALFGALLSRLTRLAGEAPASARLLDVGCGGGHLLGAARRHGWRTVGIDLAWQACAVARRADGAPVAQADAGQLPVRGGAVGAVMLVNVLDQASEPIAILREAHRVLAPGGWLVVRVPNARFHRPWVRLLTSLGPLVRLGEWDAYPILHHFAFAAPGIRQLVARAGFTILDLRNSRLAGGGAHRWWRVPVAAVAAAAALASAGRWLVGPSIELYARKAGP